MGAEPVPSKTGHANFVHLRVRSIYSLLEGAVRPKELAKLARQMRMPAVAVTDSNNLFGTYEISDTLAQSGVAEIGNVITGRAGALLDRAGVRAGVAPPVLIVGRGGLMSSLNIPRLLVPLETSEGTIDLQIALK